MSFVESIIQFNSEILGIKDRSKETLSDKEAALSFKCLHEEADEFMLSHQDGDYIGCVDAALDSIYFAVGVLYKLGLSSDEINKAMSIVHSANMNKKAGINGKRDTGASDAIKPRDWLAPEHALKQLLLGDNNGDNS